MPELVSRLAKNPFAWAMSRILGQAPFYPNLVRHLRYGFGAENST
jgi:hypothetical protein